MPSYDIMNGFTSFSLLNYFGGMLLIIAVVEITSWVKKRRGR